MRPLRNALTGAIAGAALALATFAAPAMAQDEPPLLHRNWSFSGIFGDYNLTAAQRGFWVYYKVCSNCHSMKLMHYRDLAGIGLNENQIKAIAASVTVPKGLNDQGDPITGPGLPADQFRSPFPNDEAARAALGGALPPDLSLIVNAREGHANYVYSILNGFVTPPKGFSVPAGKYYNEYFPGHLIAMPPPLHGDDVTYADGTKPTLQQEAYDVANFLEWVANPELVQRKQIGVRVVLFLLLMTGLTYATKRKVWADVEH